jgi:hypothetical protein
MSQLPGAREFKISLTETRQITGTNIGEQCRQSVHLDQGPARPRDTFVAAELRPADAVSCLYCRSGVGSEPRVPRVLRFSEHGRERGSEDRRQLSRWKLLVDEAQRLDQGHGVHDVAHQRQRPPWIVRGELQEP